MTLDNVFDLAEALEDEREIGKKTESKEEKERKDQGFTRAKVLILTPFRYTAL